MIKKINRSTALITTSTQADLLPWVVERIFQFLRLGWEICQGTQFPKKWTTSI